MGRRLPLVGQLQRTDGPLTAELQRSRSSFGQGQVPLRLQPEAMASAICGFCSTGCSLDIHLRDGKAVNVTPTVAYPVNLGMACPKGWQALSPLTSPDRATTPLQRNARGRLEPVDWPTALHSFVDGFRAVQERHGAASTAFLSTGQIPSEEMALLGAFAKFGMGMVHGDGNTRQCMATSVVAYKEAFGFDAPPYTYADLEQSDVIVLIGSNLCIAHPILWERICRNPHDPEIVVVDPRRTETAVAATTHYAANPKSDLTLLYGLAHLLIRNGWIDHRYITAHTNGFDDFAAHVAAFTPPRVSEATGLTVSALEDFAATIHLGERVSFWWTMGVNQSHEGVRTAQAIINLALLTGNIGRPGTGANSITGQCNAMGSRLFSNTTSLYAGRDFTSATDRSEVAQILDLDVERIPTQPSLAYDQILEGIHRGQIKGLWIVATNTAHSWINQTDAQELLQRLDFLVVQDMYATTETAQLAHLVLPAAGWGEKDGTFINSERRVGLVARVAQAPGEALSDFAIFRLLADAWGCGDMFKAWESPEAVFELLKELTRGRPCDLTGVADYRELAQRGGVQWPWSDANARQGEPQNERRLFSDGQFIHADGRARFVFEAPRSPQEVPSRAYPFTLLTGRGSSSQWHTQTRTGQSALLRTMYPADAYVEISPRDATRLDLSSGDRVVVSTARGHVTVDAMVTPAVAPGQIFMPMHYAETNRLTNPRVDPYSRQPSYKYCAADLRRPHTWER